MSGKPSLHEVLITVFLFLTAPVSAYLLVQLALRHAPGLKPPLPATRPMEQGVTDPQAADADR